MIFKAYCMSQQLFERDGYNKTSVEAIIKEVGIAKGTIYYYFKSKQDILHALVENIAKEIEAYFKTIVESKDLPVIEKLNLLMRGPKKQETVKPTIMEIIHKPENRELQEQLNIRTIERIAPLMAQVFEQGYQEGVFKMLLTVEGVQLILAGSLFVLDSGLFNWPSKKRSALLKAAQSILERVLGVKSGTLHFISTP